MTKEGLLILIKRDINWKNLGISFVVALIFVVLVMGFGPLLTLVASFVMSVIAMHLKTNQYAKCTPAFIVFLMVHLTGAIGIWAITYEFLQIKCGYAEKAKEKNFSDVLNKRYVCFSIVLALIYSWVIAFIGRVFETSEVSHIIISDFINSCIAIILMIVTFGIKKLPYDKKTSAIIVFLLVNCLRGIGMGMVAYQFLQTRQNVTNSVNDVFFKDKNITLKTINVLGIICILWYVLSFCHGFYVGFEKGYNKAVAERIKVMESVVTK